MTKIVPPEGYSISYDMGGPNGDGYTVDKLLCRITLTDNSLTIAHVYLRNGKLSAIVYELRKRAVIFNRKPTVTLQDFVTRICALHRLTGRK